MPILSCIDDLEIDIPNVWPNIGEVLSGVVQSGMIQLSELVHLLKHDFSEDISPRQLASISAYILLAISKKAVC